MTHYHHPGWQLPNGHVVRSRMEASLCNYLTAAACAHTHGSPESLSFNVTIAPRRRALFVPSIILNAQFDGRTVIIEPLDSIRPGGGLRRLQGFRKAHYTEYFVVVVARRALRHHIPEASYDLLVPLEDFGPLDEILRAL